MSSENHNPSLPEEMPTSQPDQSIEEERVATPPPSSSQASLPPEAQGETNGGPLGCCLGIIAGLFLATLLFTGLPLLTGHSGLLGNATIPIVVVGAVVGGYLGWRIGYRIYKEYEPPIMKGRKRISPQKARAKAR